VLREFREFISRGNVVDLAVAVVIGAAFTSVVNSVVEGLITPLVGVIVDRDFDHLDFTISDTRFQYGIVITAVVSFLAVAAVVFFLVVKPLNALEARRRRGEVTEEELSDEVLLLTEIRDLLQERRSV
jgi:large conductance mechanosensitive channel